MKTKVLELDRNVLSIHFTSLARQVVLPPLPMPLQCSVPIKFVAPEFQAEQIKARLAAEREQARREQARRRRQQRAARQATFTVD